ncbi:G patch domain protein [Quillaja saponaria]|nr:G patch domain protein [Quillaja saponaria]
MKEAAELRRQSEKEGVLAYLREPNKRSRPNSRFLTATVLGVQQANRSVEVNEMWSIRQKEKELDKRLKGRLGDGSSSNSSNMGSNSSSGNDRQATVDNTASAQCTSKRVYENCTEGLRDEELEVFLQSRTKRGRGAVGPRMDETGPYLPCPERDLSASPDLRGKRVLYGPEKPFSLMSYESSGDELHPERQKKAKTVHSGSSHKDHTKKHRTKEKSKHKKKMRKEEKSRHH